MRLFARWISIALHPLFMPFYTLLLAFALDLHLSFFLAPRVVDLPGLGEIVVRDEHLLFILVFIMTILFPLSSTIFLQRGGAVSDLRMVSRGERIAPFLLTLFYYALAYWLVRRSDHHEAVASMFTGAMFVLALVTVITLRWKISAHMAGIGGLIGVLAGLLALHGSFPVQVLAAAVLVAGVLGSARLLDSDHSPSQLAAGLVLGFGVTFTCVARTLHI